MVANYTRKLKRTQVDKLPQNPGVYIFKKGKEILYIGKAANLRDRVKQHKALLLSDKQRVAYVETGSEIEALILEAKLIKKYKPKYNVLWRDDKNYFFVAITKEKLPRVFITHQIQNSKVKSQNDKSKIKINYLGPFVEGTALKNTLRFLRKVFPYYSVKKHPKTRCLWCHLKLCPGPNPDPKEYQKNIKNLVKVLEGKRKSVLLELEKEMKKASQKQNFEKAAKIREQIFSLEKVWSHAKVLQPRQSPVIKKLWPFYDNWRRIEGYDVSNIQGKKATGSLVTFVNGKPDRNFYRRFKIRLKETPDDTAMLREVLTRRFNHPEWPFPDLILIDGGKAQLSSALKVTRQVSQASLIPVMALAKDKKHKGVKLYTSWLKEPLLLSELPAETRRLILRIDSEAHRFAISYHRKLRYLDLFGKS